MINDNQPQNKNLESENNNASFFQKHINSSKNRLFKEDDFSKSNNELHTSQLVSVSRLAKTPDNNVRRLSSQNINLLGDSEQIRIKKNEISFNNYNIREDYDPNSNKSLLKMNSLNNKSNESNKSIKKDFDFAAADQFENKSIKSNDIHRKKSISISNYIMDVSYKEVSKEDENSFQLNDNNIIRMNNSLFEEVKNDSNRNSIKSSTKNRKNNFF